jgi:hypothetical protein
MQKIRRIQKVRRRKKVEGKFSLVLAKLGQLVYILEKVFLIFLLH